MTYALSRRYVLLGKVSLLAVMWLALVGVPLQAQVAVPAGGGSNLDLLEGQDYIVIFRPGLTPAQRAGLALGAGAVLKFNYRTVNAVAIRVPNSRVLEALQRNPAVQAVVPDRRVLAIGEPVEEGSNGKGKGGKPSPPSGQVVLEGVKRVGIPTSTSNGFGVGVAIVDTGIDFNHEDLAPALQYYSAFGGSCQDDNGHGTHVAGIVAALDNQIDVVGVAPQAILYCVKVLDQQGSGSDSTLIAGLDWIAQNHATVNPAISVVNMSLGRPGTIDDNPALRQAAQNLYNAGITVVVSAGNDPAKEVSQMVPATYPEVLAVASTTAIGGDNKCRFY